MVERKVIVKSETGLHARPAGLIVKEASKYKSAITLVKNDKEYNAKSIMGIMSMAAGMNDEITVRANGEDETEALEKIVEIIMMNQE